MVENGHVEEAALIGGRQRAAWLDEELAAATAESRVRLNQTEEIWQAAKSRREAAEAELEQIMEERAAKDLYTAAESDHRRISSARTAAGGSPSAVRRATVRN
jgi:predicted  nucleic acid-binding Zn-ribbon protein